MLLRGDDIIVTIFIVFVLEIKCNRDNGMDFTPNPYGNPNIYPEEYRTIDSTNELLRRLLKMYELVGLSTNNPTIEPWEANKWSSKDSLSSSRFDLCVSQDQLRPFSHTYSSTARPIYFHDVIKPGYTSVMRPKPFLSSHPFDVLTHNPILVKQTQDFFELIMKDLGINLDSFYYQEQFPFIIPITVSEMYNLITGVDSGKLNVYACNINPKEECLPILTEKHNIKFPEYPESLNLHSLPILISPFGSISYQNTQNAFHERFPEINNYMQNKHCACIGLIPPNYVNFFPGTHQEYASYANYYNIVNKVPHNLNLVLLYTPNFKLKPNYINLIIFTNSHEVFDILKPFVTDVTDSAAMQLQIPFNISHPAIQTLGKDKLLQFLLNFMKPNEVANKPITTNQMKPLVINSNEVEMPNPIFSNNAMFIQNYSESDEHKFKTFLNILSLINVLKTPKSEGMLGSMVIVGNTNMSEAAIYHKFSLLFSENNNQSITQNNLNFNITYFQNVLKLLVSNGCKLITRVVVASGEIHNEKPTTFSPDIKPLLNNLQTIQCSDPAFLQNNHINDTYLQHLVNMIYQIGVLNKPQVNASIGFPGTAQKNPSCLQFSSNEINPTKSPSPASSGTNYIQITQPNQNCLENQIINENSELTPLNNLTDTEKPGKPVDSITIPVFNHETSMQPPVLNNYHLNNSENLVGNESITSNKPYHNSINSTQSFQQISHEPHPIKFTGSSQLSPSNSTYMNNINNSTFIQHLVSSLNSNPAKPNPDILQWSLDSNRKPVSNGLLPNQLQLISNGSNQIFQNYQINSSGSLNLMNLGNKPNLVSGEMIGGYQKPHGGDKIHTISQWNLSLFPNNHTHINNTQNLLNFTHPMNSINGTQPINSIFTYPLNSNTILNFTQRNNSNTSYLQNKPNGNSFYLQNILSLMNSTKPPLMNGFNNSNITDAQYLLYLIMNSKNDSRKPSLVNTETGFKPGSDTRPDFSQLNTSNKIFLQNHPYSNFTYLLSLMNASNSFTNPFPVSNSGGEIGLNYSKPFNVDLSKLSYSDLVLLQNHPQYSSIFLQYLVSLMNSTEGFKNPMKFSNSQNSHYGAEVHNHWNTSDPTFMQTYSQLIAYLLYIQNKNSSDSFNEHFSGLANGQSYYNKPSEQSFNQWNMSDSTSLEKNPQFIAYLQQLQYINSSDNLHPVLGGEQINYQISSQQSNLPTNLWNISDQMFLQKNPQLISIYLQYLQSINSTDASEEPIEFHNSENEGISNVFHKVPAFIKWLLSLNISNPSVLDSKFTFHQNLANTSDWTSGSMKPIPIGTNKWPIHTELQQQNLNISHLGYLLHNKPNINATYMQYLLSMINGNSSYSQPESESVLSLYNIHDKPQISEINKVPDFNQWLMSINISDPMFLENKSQLYTRYIQYLMSMVDTIIGFNNSNPESPSQSNSMTQNMWQWVSNISDPQILQSHPYNNATYLQYLLSYINSTRLINSSESNVFGNNLPNNPFLSDIWSNLNNTTHLLDRPFNSNYVNTTGDKSSPFFGVSSPKNVFNNIKPNVPFFSKYKPKPISNQIPLASYLG